MREWLDGVEIGHARPLAAAFDTRFKKPRWMVGSAVVTAEKRLRRLGLPIVMSAESFYVRGTPGPLLDGERERARSWGDRIGAQVQCAGQEKEELCEPKPTTYEA